MSEAWLDSVLDHFDQGTQRAILRLYRSASPGRARGGRRAVGTASDARPGRVGHARSVHTRPLRAEYANALGHAQLLELPDAGHVPWLDRPEVVERVASFLSATPG